MTKVRPSFFHLASRFLLTVVATALIGGCANSRIQSLGDIHLANLQKDFETQKTLFESKRQAVDDQAIARLTKITAGDSQDPQKFIQVITANNTDVNQLYQIAGRAQVTNRFLIYASNLPADPPASLFDSWFISEYENIKQEDQAVTSETTSLLSNLNAGINEEENWIKQLYYLSARRGSVIGEANQLKALHGIVISYLSDVAQIKRDDAEQRMRQSQGLLNALTVYSQVQYQQQVVNALNSPQTLRLNTTCTRYGNVTNCR